MKKFMFTALLGVSALAFAAGAMAEGDAAIRAKTQLNSDAAPSSADNSVAHGVVVHSENAAGVDSISATSTTGTKAGTASGTIDENLNASGQVGTKDGDDEANTSARASVKSDNDAAEDQAELSQDLNSKTGIMKTRAKGAMGMLNPGEVKTVQSNLKEAGYNVSVDGVWGKNTRAALKEYQKSKNLNITGKMDADTRASLGMDNKAATPDSNKY
jgi:hypothetical protein